MCIRRGITLELLLSIGIFVSILFDQLLVFRISLFLLVGLFFGFSAGTAGTAGTAAGASLILRVGSFLQPEFAGLSCVTALVGLHRSRFHERAGLAADHSSTVIPASASSSRIREQEFRDLCRHGRNLHIHVVTRSMLVVSFGPAVIILQVTPLFVVPVRYQGRLHIHLHCIRRIQGLDFHSDLRRCPVILVQKHRGHFRIDSAFRVQFQDRFLCLVLLLHDGVIIHCENTKRISAARTDIEGSVDHNTVRGDEGIMLPVILCKDTASLLIHMDLERSGKQARIRQ